MNKGLIFPLGKLLGVLAVKRTLDTAVFHQLLVGAAILVLLTVVAALMLAILITGGLYGTYVALLTYGLESEAAMIMVGSLTVLITVVVILIMRVQVNKLHGMIRNIFKQQSPIADHLTGIAQSFLDGLTKPEPVVQPLYTNKKRKG